MRCYDEAYNNLAVIEGGYVNDKDDLGAETYRGISRKFHPNWEGWNIIDKYKKNALTKKQLNIELSQDEQLQELVKQFYYDNYWIKFNGDALPCIIAEELLEQAVLLGTWKTAGENLQKALNMLNKDGKLFPDLVVDGIVGPKTLDALSKIPTRLVLKVLNYLEFGRFAESINKRPTNEKFLWGWLNRV